jgi:hypothetical protein
MWTIWSKGERYTRPPRLDLEGIVAKREGQPLCRDAHTELAED